MAINKKRVVRLVRTLIFALLLGGVIYLLGWSHIFSVKSVEIQGTQNQTTLSRALENSGIAPAPGISIARVDVRAIARTAENLGWIEKLNISRNWFTGKILMRVAERTPVARFVDDKGVTRYFGADGFTFGSPQERLSLPEITFAANTEPSRLAAAQWLADLPADFIATMTSVSVLSETDISMQGSDLTNSKKTICVQWGSSKDMTLKVKVLRALLAAPENLKRNQFDISNPIAPITR